MKLTIETYSDPTKALTRVKREFGCDFIIVEPYNEGTTSKGDQPCLTLAFDNGKDAYACAHYINELPNSKQVDVDPYEEKTEKTWFIHFWQVPEATTVSLGKSK